ncbi:MAG: serine hydrolase domain-containing protein [Thermoanaerobaculia bacterium]
MRALAALLLLLTIPLAARDFGAVDREIESRMQAGGVPGAAVVVVEGGRVVHARAFGVRNIESNDPVTTATLFRLGSTTKMFVAAAAMRLVDTGKLKLDAPIGDVLPDLGPELRALTLEQLLTHQSGLHDDAPMQGPLDESALHARVKSWTASAFFTRPGEIFSYANPGYVLAGDVLSAVTGKTFSETMEELVLRPADAKSATFRPLVAMTHPLAVGHDAGPRVARPFAEHAGNYPPGSLFVSADDLGRLFIANTPLFERLGVPRAPIPAQRRHYGYGLVVQDYRGGTLALHTGARSGYGSVIFILPKQRVAIGIIANRTGAIFASAAFAAVDLYLDGPEAKDEQPREQPLDASDFALAGTYVNSDAIRVTLAAENGALRAKFAGRSLAVTKIGNDHYRVEPGTQLESFTIVRDSGGAPRYLASAVWALRKEDTSHGH